MSQYDPASVDEQNRLTNSALGLALLGQSDGSFPIQEAQKYKLSGYILVGQYGAMIHQIVADTRDKRALLGARQLVEIAKEVDQKLASNQWVAITANFESRTYGNFKAETPVGPFEAWDPHQAFMQAAELPTQRIWYLHGGRPAITLAQPADESPALVKTFKHLLGMGNTLQDALREAAPTTPEQVRAINSYIDKMMRQAEEDKTSALPEEPSEGKEPIEVAGLSEEALAELNRRIGDIVDIPPAPPDAESPVVPPTGDVGVASVPGTRALRTEREEPAPAGAAPAPAPESSALLQQYLAKRAALLDGLLRLSDAAFARRPPIPPYPGGSAPPGGFTLRHEDVRKLAGDEAPMTADGPAVMLATLLRAVPELKSFHKLRKSASEDEAAWEAMLLGGRWRTGTESVAPGDLVYLATPMLEGGGCWALALKAQQRTVTEAMVVYPGQNKYHFVQRVLGVTARAWQPTAMPVLSDTAPMGQFWGPKLKRLRTLLENHLFVPAGAGSIDRFLGDLTAKRPFETESFEELLHALGPELYLITPQTPLYAGCILLTDRDNEVGVRLSDGRILGVTLRASHGSPFRMEPRKFQPQYVWYPHL